MPDADSSPAPTAPVLAVRALGHDYPGHACLDDVSLEVAAGELVTILGRSGCGKSTLLRAIAGLVTPQRGSIDIAGDTVVSDGRERTPAERRAVGLVFQEYALFPHMSVADNVAFGVVDQPDRGAARVRQMLELVGLSDLSDRLPAQLSGGQQQRVALARALAPGPQLLLLDEPFANLDAALRHGLRRQLRTALAEVGAAGLLVTHNREEALSVADRVLVLGRPADAPEAGARVLREGPPEQVYAEPRLRAVALLTGEASFLPSETDPEVIVALRPEDARFDADPEGACEIIDVQFAGGRSSVTVDTPDGPVILEVVSGEALPRRGARGRLRRVRPGSAVDR